MPGMANTAADGTFKLSGIAPGPVTLTAYSSDRRLSSPPLPVTAPFNDATLTLPRGARIEGRIFDRTTQQPITDFSILLPGRANPNFSGNPNVVTSASNSFTGGPPIHADDGHYALDNVPPGTNQIMVN